MSHVEVTLLTAEQALGAKFPPSEQAQLCRRFLTPLWEKGSAHYIANVDTSLYVALVDDTFAIPLTMTSDFRRANAYVCSLKNQYIDYARDELFEVPSAILRALFRLCIFVGGGLFSLFQFDRVAFVNNWLLSTNLWPDLSTKQLAALQQAVTERFADRAVVFRSLNEAVSISPDRMVELGAKRILSRQIYVNHDPQRTLKKNRQLKNDRRLIRRASWTEAHGTLVEDTPQRAQDLYDALYIDKYSQNNPRFSAALLSHWHRVGALWFTSFKQCPPAPGDTSEPQSTRGDDDADDDDGEAYGGVIGAFQLGGLLTVPVLGYDTAQPPSAALYRLLSLRLLERAAETGSVLHASAGAAAFKRFRGAVPAIEYHAVFDAHLPAWRRLAWSIFSWGSVHIAAPLFRRFEV